ncbi:ABC transporter ATP-binding protein [Rhodococcus sp. 06-156-3C]|uniref:ABC transporter ATP-binding protein n=1 Tax=Nocardiaceae TaxID=85025 RepID=UPI00068B6DB1|nr:MULTISPECIES: ABC transporter ATP-binding protein [Rhodococcus]OZD08779.1 ABC transporter ATP-binding protein [Rhodococcus sp. 06-156-4C]OZD17356.1 ABC transporter ATP-binding protein [Rhodococcus sp. 06-156-3C]OZD18693.1 ABC transporter ATP-binding protein [Rhodococcus sp. 06-156-4a]OZD25100.1 ABC transporter ATP-binding protein [Rhodococcus sp. 06-156-3b]OZD34259.1 ABC transporter ATP-binding protein [Rhodococcus sp. 06-156-3]
MPSAVIDERLIQEGKPKVNSLVSVNGLAKSFGRRGQETQVLRDINLEVTDGELLVLLGPSGCGKTTLLRSLVGLDQPDAGRIELGGTCVVDASRGVFVPANRRDVGMVFQNYALWPHMKVRNNVAYPLKSRGLGAALKDGRVEEVLDIVQCGHLADRYPPELSGGQQQRVSLARALAPRPALLLLDEPLSNLDALLRVELRAQLRLLHRTLGFTAVHVTHDQEEAIALGTRVAVMRSGQVEQIGDPAEVYNAPATEYVADFLGARNKLELNAQSGGSEIIGSPITGLTVDSLRGTHSIRLRDEHILVRRGQDGPVADTEARSDGTTVWIPNGRVVELLPGIETSECVIEVGGIRLFSRVHNRSNSARTGDPVDVGFDIQDARCYNTETEGLVANWARTSAHDATEATR